MKLSQNQIRLYLAKWLPFLPQKETALKRETITGEKLKEICNLISPSVDHCQDIMQQHKDKPNIFAVRNFLMVAFLYNTWNQLDDDDFDYRREFDISDLPKVNEMIADLGLSKHIILHPNTTDYANNLSEKNSVLISKIEFKNLDITGSFIGAEFKYIGKIAFTNNVFEKQVEIQVTGTPDRTQGSPRRYKCTFRNNQFKDQFWRSVFNVSSINFIGNKFLRANLSFQPPILELEPKGDIIDDHTQKCIEEFNSIRNKFEITESRLKFINNKATALFLRDHKDLAAPYKDGAIPFGKIEFWGSNAIEYLQIETHHNELNSDNSPNIRADANRIFFDASDEIGILKKSSNTKHDIHDFNLQERKYQLSYLEFFSQLKENVTRQQNPVLDDIYAKKIRYFSRFFVSRWEDKFIFHWGDWVSDGGESWTKPLGWFVLFQFALSLMAWLSISSVSFGALLFEFLNPLSGLSSLDPDEIPAWAIALLLLLHKLVAAVTIYEAVKALRRFSK